jgi:hypothetical protein
MFMAIALLKTSFGAVLLVPGLCRRRSAESTQQSIAPPLVNPGRLIKALFAPRLDLSRKLI